MQTKYYSNTDHQKAIGYKFSNLSVDKSLHGLTLRRHSMASLIFMMSSITYRLVTLTINRVTSFLQLKVISHIHQNKTETKKIECLKIYECFQLNNEAKTCTNWILFFGGGGGGGSAAENSNFARLLSSIRQHSFNSIATGLFNGLYEMNLDLVT